MTVRSRADFIRDRDDSVVILLVDDELIEAELFRGLLEAEEDLEFHYCQRVEDALVQANQIQPTVIMQDLSMPGDHGLTMISRFRANPTTKDTPVVVFSGQEDARTKSIAFSLGANDYIVKSVDRIELLARLRYHSRAYWNQQKREEATRALRESERELWDSNASLIESNRKLTEALAEVKQLTGLLPMCACCRRVRDEENYWSEFSAYIAKHTDLRLTHGLCDECLGTQAAKMGMTPQQVEVLTQKFQKHRTAGDASKGGTGS
ncbi:MAG: response regulator [Chthoniobacter sp.]|nr:response regulator [Chthoniobacter sp.]